VTRQVSLLAYPLSNARRSAEVKAGVDGRLIYSSILEAAFGRPFVRALSQRPALGKAKIKVRPVTSNIQFIGVFGSRTYIGSTRIGDHPSRGIACSMESRHEKAFRSLRRPLR
jgi:hypothetical protein